MWCQRPGVTQRKTVRPGRLHQHVSTQPQPRRTPPTPSASAARVPTARSRTAATAPRRIRRISASLATPRRESTATRHGSALLPERAEHYGHQRSATDAANGFGPGDAQAAPPLKRRSKQPVTRAYGAPLTPEALCRPLRAWRRGRGPDRARRTLYLSEGRGERRGPQGWGKPVCRLPVARLPWRLWT
jgi:hypothetical protein